MKTKPRMETIPERRAPRRKRPEGLITAERRAEREMRAALHDPVLLATLTFNLLGRTVAAVPPDDPAMPRAADRVGRRLLLRVANDLRAASRLACLGYTEQAAALIAGLYEVAFTVVHVGKDVQKAMTWIEHADPVRGPWSAKRLTESVAARVDPKTAEKTAEKVYRRYTQLCMAKHAHPIVQMQHLKRVAPGMLEASHGPDTSERAQRTASFALLHGVGLALVAQGMFVLDHIPRERREELLKMRGFLDGKRAQLNEGAAARWPGRDPFPGKWVRFAPRK